MEKKGNDLLITSKGKQLLELVPQDLKKPELTARWEKELQRISEGRQKESSFMREIERYTNDVYLTFVQVRGHFGMTILQIGSARAVVNECLP
mgnify:CR=1 FL=1